jgi:hypothetical protein
MSHPQLDIINPAAHAQLSAYIRTIRELLGSGNSVWHDSPSKLTCPTVS